VYEDTPTIILGAHYDSRLLADQEVVPQPGRAVPGANDGASGVAILLELARSLPEDTVPVWLVFFDAEDNGGLEGRDWIMGSRAFVANMMFSPQAVVIVDMVGDADLNIYIEINSDPVLVQEIWGQAVNLGYMQFIMEKKHSILDDHSAFLEAGIPAVDIIDFDYPFWHTQADTPDKISVESLQAVGETLWTWITLK
jgi:glutaminyl-peptide cyclotransferase